MYIAQKSRGAVSGWLRGGAGCLSSNALGAGTRSDLGFRHALQSADNECWQIHTARFGLVAISHSLRRCLVGQLPPQAGYGLL